MYITSGAGSVSYTPSFAVAGFRYITVSGLPPTFTPTLAMFTSRFIHTDVDPVGDLRMAVVAGDDAGTPDVLNRIHHMVRYSQMSNLMSIPTDCPQRERRGWMGDAQVTSNEAMLNFDMEALYTNFFTDMRNEQLLGCASRHRDGGGQTTCGGGTAEDARGSLPDVVPYDGIGGYPGGPVWQVAYIVIARHHWKNYGDPNPIKENWAGLTDLMGYFQRHVDRASGLFLKGKYGDWVCAGAHGGCPRTPASMVTAFYYVQALGFLAELAVPAGRPAAEVQSWAVRHNEGVRAFHAKFYNANVSGYSPEDGEPRGSQTSNSMALALGAPPDEATRAAVMDALVANTEFINGNHTTFGIVGSVWTHPMLEFAGRGDVALSTLTTDAYPGYVSSWRDPSPSRRTTSLFTA